MVASFLEYMQKEGETDERYRKKAISVGTKMQLWCAAPNQAARELRSKGKAPVWLYMPACFEETRFVTEFGHCARRGASRCRQRSEIVRTIDALPAAYVRARGPPALPAEGSAPRSAPRSIYSARTRGQVRLNFDKVRSDLTDCVHSSKLCLRKHRCRAADKCGGCVRALPFCTLGGSH